MTTIVASAILLAIAAAGAEGPQIVTRVYQSPRGDTMPYRLLVPVGHDAGGTYPLVLCLHGAGGRGDDNRSRGTEAFTALSAPAVQDKHPALLLTPQCPRDRKWVNTPWNRGSYSVEQTPITREMELVLEILDAVRKEYRVDPDRIYVTGQSMGGYGTWDVALRHPELFAAAAPVCGAGDPSAASRIASLPVWAFHGDKDTTVPVAGSREMVTALKAAQGSVRYTEFAGVGHGSWVPAWKDPELITWLFEQRRPTTDLR